MRILLAIPLLMLGACNVSKEGNSVTVQYDQNTAENTAADIGNTAQNIAADIGNDVQKTGDKIENKVGNSDVSINVNHDEKTDNNNKVENKQ
jgi:gas vesicle protein